LELGGIEANQGMVDMEKIITIDDKMHSKKETEQWNIGRMVFIKIMYHSPFHYSIFPAS
jgi:hypothetical protein